MSERSVNTMRRRNVETKRKEGERELKKARLIYLVSRSIGGMAMAERSWR